MHGLVLLAASRWRLRPVRTPALHKVYTPETIEAAVKAFEKRLEGREMRTEQDAATGFPVTPSSGDGTTGK